MLSSVPHGFADFGFAVVADRDGLDVARKHATAAQDGIHWQRIGDLYVTTRPSPSTQHTEDSTGALLSPEHILVFDGRIDNRACVAATLRDERLATKPDAVVMSAAYQHWRDTVCQFVVGEYAFVSIEYPARRIFAGQDSLGVRRLFYSTVTDGFWISSNLRFFFRLFPEFRPQVDGEVLPEYFAGTMWPWTGRTLWRGVKELRRRHVLVRMGQALEEREDWRPADAFVSFRSEPEVDEQFRALATEAVRVRLRSSGRVLCDLSGGYDSSVICLLAASQSRAEDLPPVVAWSYAHSARSDEGLFQRAVANASGVELHTLDVSRHLPFELILDSEIPTGGGFLQAGAVTAAVRHLASSVGATCRLSGHGGDALFLKGSPAPVYLSDLLRQGRFAEWHRHFALHVRHGSFSAWSLLRDCTLGTLATHAGRRRRPTPDWVTRSFAARIEDAELSFNLTAGRVSRSDARERLFRGVVAFLPYNGHLLPDERLPYLHRPLVEFVMALDWKYMVRPPEDRWLLRRAFRDALPSELARSAAVSPHTAGLMEGLRKSWQYISPLITGEQLGALGVVEPRRFKQAVERFRLGEQGVNPQHIKTALYLELWLATKALPSSVWTGDLLEVAQLDPATRQ